MDQKENSMKTAIAFNKGWKRLCKGQYENGSWFIRRCHRTGSWDVKRDKGAARLPADFGEKYFRKLDDAKRAVNQWEYDNSNRKNGGK